MAPLPHAGRVDGRTVLLADDDEDFRFALAEGLEADGYDVVAVPNGEAVLAALEDATEGRLRPPDLLVLDLLMPRMGAIEVLQRLRKSAQWAELPVLVVTGVNDPMLPVRLDVPIAFKPDANAVLAAVRQHVANVRATGPAKRTPEPRP
jgi:CheY-like chemotaxis protein